MLITDRAQSMNAAGNTRAETIARSGERRMTDARHRVDVLREPGKQHGAVAIFALCVLGLSRLLWHTRVMVTLLSRFRLASARHRRLDWLCVMALFGLIVGGIPQWEVHQHAAADHDHGHHHSLAAPDVDDAPPLVPASDGAGTHGHATPSMPVALIEPELRAFDGVAPRVPDFPATDLLAPACCWPPPYRPPIA